MGEVKNTDSVERKHQAEARLAASRPLREAAAAAHARSMARSQHDKDTFVSLHVDEIRSIKSAITHGAPYADRISLGFAIRLFWLEHELREAHNVLQEIDFLESLSETSITQASSQFKYPPLAPFWHKHFWSSRHLLRNIGNRWGVHPDKMAGKHKALDAMISDVARHWGEDLEAWQKILTYNFVMKAIEERTAEKRMTGDWIVFAKYRDKNYYLDLALHEEGDDAEALACKIRRSAQTEFPFLF